MYTTYIMKRTQIYLDERQDALLSKRASATGTTKSRLIREALDRYLGTGDDRSQRASRFRAAVEEVAGIAPYLPDGARYVDEVRQADVERTRELEARRA